MVRDDCTGHATWKFSCFVHTVYQTSINNKHPKDPYGLDFVWFCTCFLFIHWSSDLQVVIDSLRKGQSRTRAEVKIIPYLHDTVDKIQLCNSIKKHL